MSSTATRPRLTPKTYQGHKVRVGDKVGINWAGRGLLAHVVEDRGNLGAHGERVVRLDIAEGAEQDERMQIEVPVDWLAMMVRVQGVFVRNGTDEDVSNEIVAFLKQKADELLSLEIHFGLTGHREGFVGNRYSVEVPVAAAQLVRKATVENGYQLGGTLRIVDGRVVIDDPIGRPKPHGARVRYEPSRREG
jgi:hypothetical protein